MSKIYKFKQEELVMYNTLLTSSVLRVLTDRLIDVGAIRREDVATDYFDESFIKTHFERLVDEMMDELSKGSFSLELFEFDEDE